MSTETGEALSNASSAAALQKQIKRLNEAEKFIPKVAPRIAAEAAAEIRKNVQNQVGPDGKPWPKSKSGEPVLLEIADRMRVEVRGSVIVMSLEGHYSRHHLGAVKGKVRRPVLPSGGTPDAFVVAISKIIGDEWSRTMFNMPDLPAAIGASVGSSRDRGNSTKNIRRGGGTRNLRRG